MSLNTEKLTGFATAVGQDIKRLDNDKLNVADFNDQLAAADPQKLQTVVMAVLQSATLPQVEALKAEILGEGVPEGLDTLKELADAISNMGDSATRAIVEKVTELSRKIDTIESVDLVSVYNQAKV